MNEIRRCSAPIEKNHRCSNLTIGSSDHCKTHSEKTKPLYIKYKQIQKKLEKYKIDTTDSNNLLRYYSLLRQLYDARCDHRFAAYVPECFDYGHDKQFEILLSQISCCEEFLSKLFESSDSYQGKVKKITETSDTSAVIETESEEVTTENIHIKISKFKAKRSHDKEEEERLLDIYINENREEYNQRVELVEKIDRFFNVIISHFGDLDYPIITKVAIYNLMGQLYLSGFFEDSFKFKLCSCKRDYRNIKVGLLECGCVLRYTNLESSNIFKFFLLQIAGKNLTTLLKILEEKFVRLCPIIKELAQLHKIFGDNIYKTPLAVVRRVSGDKIVAGIEAQAEDRIKAVDWCTDKWTRTPLKKLEEDLEIEEIVDLLKGY